MNTNTFPVLYNKGKLGKVKKWEIWVIDKGYCSCISVETGFLPDGKMTVFETYIEGGKNIGKSNETTHYTQAIAEAQSRWNQKKNQEGYTESEEYSVKRPILPMLCNKYEDRSKDIVFPCYVQPKIDGLRGIYQKIPDKNNWALYSRLGNIFPHLETISNELSSVKIPLDGELYSDGTLTFQQINGLVRKKTLNKEDLKNLESIRYIVYDTVNNLPFKERYEELKNLFKNNNFKHVLFLKADICKNDSEIIEFHNKYVSDGYEGIIIRNNEGGYEEKHRSKNLLKYKIFQDAEFVITGFTEGEGTEKGAIVWSCETSNKQSFNVRPAGSMGERKKLYKNGKKYIGLLLTVKYFELTDDGIPRFPTTIHGGTADIRNLDKKFF